MRYVCPFVVAVLLCVIGWPARLPAQSLEGTAALTAEGDIAAQMVAGIDKFLLREIDQSVERRAKYWRRDTSSPEAYNKSVEANRQRLKKMIGAVDERTPYDAPELVDTLRRPALVARGETFDVFAVRWPVFRGVHGEGLLLTPRLHMPLADCVVLPDADQTPETLAGLTEGPPHAQIAKRLAENRCRVLIPTSISRDSKFSILDSGQKIDLPHRELVYRPAYELGRHIIGYEVQKALAAVDWFVQDSRRLRDIGVFGYGEGGLVALYAAAVDPRIDACLVSGYFDDRGRVWREPIYRNVFGLLHEFGDAELASLVAPRSLIVEASAFPKIDNVPPVREGGRPKTIAAPGELVTPGLERVRGEFQRAEKLIAGLNPQRFELIASGENGDGPFATEAAIAAFVHALLPDFTVQPPGASPSTLRKDFETDARQRRQLEELLADTQHLLKEAEYTREGFLEQARGAALDDWKKISAVKRREFYDEVIGRFERPLLDAHPRTRQIYDTPEFVGHEVMLDVFPDVFAYGILLVPKDIKPGERRPVVVCQHGLEGRPQDVANPEVNHPAYHQFACELARRGFITYAPQNPYIGYDRFRTLQRKANPLKRSLYSVITPQHQQTTDWLASLPMVDPQRIGFYGLSYGGKTAMRVPALVDNYCLSICSADFNEWIWKNASLRSRYTYVKTIEYEMFDFNLGNTFNYAEMAGLIAPRPFMVERGHRDGVSNDQRVAYEYAKIRHMYADLKISERTTIEFFDGPHTIHGVGTFAFLHEHLRWPRKDQRAIGGFGAVSSRTPPAV